MELFLSIVGSVGKAVMDIAAFSAYAGTAALAVVAIITLDGWRRQKVLERRANLAERLYLAQLNLAAALVVCVEILKENKYNSNYIDIIEGQVNDLELKKDNFFDLWKESLLIFSERSFPIELNNKINSFINEIREKMRFNPILFGTGKPIIMNSASINYKTDTDLGQNLDFIAKVIKDFYNIEKENKIVSFLRKLL